MDEITEGKVIRLCNIIVAQRYVGQMDAAREIAEQILNSCQQVDLGEVQDEPEEPPIHESLDPVKVHIRYMIRRDMPEVLEIEHGSYEFPWSEEDFVRYMRQRNVIGMVAEHDDQIVGFMIYELHKKRVHPLSVAVHPDWRRRNIGTALIDQLKAKSCKERRHKIVMEVRETNLTGQLFLKSVSFRAVAVVPGGWDFTADDAYVMKYSIAKQRST